MAVSLSLALVRWLTLGPVVAIFPLATLAVFAFGCDREATADVVAVVFSFGLFLGCTTSLWPLAELQKWTWNERVDSVAKVFMVISYVCSN